MYTLRGVLAAVFMALSSALWCTLLYLIGIVRFAFKKGSKPHLAVGNLMERAVDGWVGSNKRLIWALRIADIETPALLDELGRNRWYVVVCNHQSWTDIIVLQNTFLQSAPPLKFFTKKELIYVPFVGLAMWFLGFPYVARYSRERLDAEPHLRDVDRKATLDACNGFLERPTTVLSFLEGTRFTREKHAAQESPYNHLLSPKSGGLGYVADALSDHLDGIIDVTIHYPDGVPSFWDFLCGRCRQIQVAAQLRAAPPSDREQLKTWVNEVWQAKDADLAVLKAASPGA